MKEVLIGIGIIVLIGIIYNQGRKDAVLNAPTTTYGQPKPPENIEATYKDSYMAGCVGGTATYQYCSCAWTEMRKDYSLTKMNEVFSNKNEDEVLALVMPYARTCASQLGQTESN